MAADARLSGRGGGDPKGVSAGGGTSKSARSMRSAVTCVNTLVVVLLAVHLVVLLAVEGALLRTTMQSGIVRLCRVTKSVILVTRLTGWAQIRKCLSIRALRLENRRLLPLSGGKQVENETGFVF